MHRSFSAARTGTQVTFMTSVVVIDNVKSNRQILRKIIETIDPNIIVHDFDCAEKAFCWISNQVPNLVITDYKMPGLNGLELTKAIRLRTRSQKTPVLMLTMADDLALPIYAREAGVTAFLRRPIDHQLLRTRIANLLAHSNKRSRLKLIVNNPSSVG